MMLGAPISVSQWIFWNLLPVTLGNLVAGALLTGAALYVTYPAEQASAPTLVQLATAEQEERPAAFAAASGMHPM
jgi:hypothetical protein